MLVLVPLAVAEPLRGGTDLSTVGQVRVEPGAEVFPVLGNGGIFISELFVGVGLPKGFDIRGGAGIYAMLYSTNDGKIVDEPYMPPGLGFVDVVARWTAPAPEIYPEDRLSVGIRVDNRPWSARYFGADEWGIGPEFAVSHHAGPAWVHFRPNYLVHPYWLPDTFGQLNVESSVSLPLGSVEPFVDVAPRMWLGLGHSGNSGLIFMPAFALAIRAGAQLHFGDRHGIDISGTFSPEHRLDEDDFALFAGYRFRSG